LSLRWRILETQWRFHGTPGMHTFRGIATILNKTVTVIMNEWLLVVVRRMSATSYYYA
jgi:hypothetical protein